MEAIKIVENTQNDNGDGNNRSNSGNLGGSPIRRVEFYYTTTTRVASTKLHDINHVPNPKKPDTMARTESYSHADTNCSENNMTLLSYIIYKCNVIGLNSDLKLMEIPVATAVTAYDYPLFGTTFMLLFNQALWLEIIMVQSLIATNQVRSHGIQLSENFYDQNRPLEIFKIDT